MKTNTLDALINKLTAFRTLADLKKSTDAGYVPTIYRRDANHSRLIRELRSRGIKVWTGE